MCVFLFCFVNGEQTDYLFSIHVFFLFLSVFVFICFILQMGNSQIIILFFYFNPFFCLFVGFCFSLFIYLFCFVL